MSFGILNRVADLVASAAAACGFRRAPPVPPLTAAATQGIVSHTANYMAGHLDQVFAALSDSTRRTILSRLARGQALTVSELAEPFPIKLPSVMKHLDVLGEAGLIRRTKTGRTVMVVISPQSLRPAMNWLEYCQSTRPDQTTAYTEGKECETREKDE